MDENNINIGFLLTMSRELVSEFNKISEKSGLGQLTYEGLSEMAQRAFTLYIEAVKAEEAGLTVGAAKNAARLDQSYINIRKLG